MLFVEVNSLSRLTLSMGQIAIMMVLSYTNVILDFLGKIINSDLRKFYREIYMPQSCIYILLFNVVMKLGRGW